VKNLGVSVTTRCFVASLLSMTSLKTTLTEPELSSVRYAHEENPAALQPCAQRALLRLCPNILWFDLVIRHIEG